MSLTVKQMKRERLGELDIRQPSVAVAKNLAFDMLYHRLETKEGEKKALKLARVRERKTRDLGVVRCIKDENGKVLAEVAEIKER